MALSRTGRSRAALAGSLAMLVAGGGFLAWDYARELPPGFTRIHYGLLQPLPGDPPTAVPESAVALDGREVLQQVRGNPDLQLTKVIAMSGKMSEEELKGLLAIGFDGHLKKPFHVRQVIEAVEDAMAVVY